MTTLSGLDGPPPAPGGVPVAVAGKRPRVNVFAVDGQTQTRGLVQHRASHGIHGLLRCRGIVG